VEDFKIEHFLKENSGMTFPHYESLSASANEEIRVRICDAFGFPSSLAGATLTTHLAQLQSHVEGIDAENENFDLKAFTKSVGISVQNKVFVNWHQFDKIDKLSFEDLAAFFNDIWYPSSDDIDIFDSSFSWIVSITHDGEIQLSQLSAG